MKPHRTPLLADAVSGSVRPPHAPALHAQVPGEAANQASWDAAKRIARDAAAEQVPWNDAQQVPWDAAEHDPRSAAGQASWNDADQASWNAARENSWDAAEQDAWNTAGQASWNGAEHDPRNAAEHISWNEERDPWNDADQVPWDSAEQDPWNDAEQAPRADAGHDPWNGEEQGPWDRKRTITGARPSAALRERLSQTRARIARAHAEHPPQINVDWDPEEPPTRLYQGGPLHSLPVRTRSAERSADHTPANPLADFARAHFQAKQTRPGSQARATPAPATDKPLTTTSQTSQQRSFAKHDGPLAEPSTRAQPRGFVSHADHVEELAASAQPRAFATHATPLAEPPAVAAPRGFASRAAPGAESAASARPRGFAAHATPRTDPGAGAQPRARAVTHRGLAAVAAEPINVRAAAQASSTPASLLPRGLRSEVEFPTEHIAPRSERVTLQPLATRLLREACERVGKLYAGVDRSDSALRRRVVYCSIALIVIAAMSRILFGGQPGTRVLVTVHPVDAHITLDGDAHEGDKSPRVLEDIAAGEHELVVEKPGFLAQRQKFTVTAGELEHPVSLKLTAVLQSANVSVSSDPPGAQIFLNGQASNHVTPAKLNDLAPGRHVIALKLDGYADAKEALHLPEDGLVSIKLASLQEPRFVETINDSRALTRSEQRAQARELARERRAAARAAKVLLRYRARMGLPPDPVAQELVDAYGPAASAE